MEVHETKEERERKRKDGEVLPELMHRCASGLRQCTGWTVRPVRTILPWGSLQAMNAGGDLHQSAHPSHSPPTLLGRHLMNRP